MRVRTWEVALGLLVACSAACGSSNSKSSNNNKTPTCACPSGQSCVGNSCLAVATGCALPPVEAAAAQAPTQVTELAGEGNPAKVGTVLQFDVPAGTQSLSITEQAVHMAEAAISVQYPGTSEFADYNSAVPLVLHDPSGHEVFNDLTSGSNPEQELVYFGSSAPGAGTITIPGTSAALAAASAGLPAGTWSLTVSDYAYECSLPGSPCTTGASSAGTYGVTVVTRPGTPGSLPAAGTMDVVFYLVGSSVSPPLSAATAAGDRDVHRMLQTYESLLAQAGIALGSVEYVDADASVAQRFASGVHGDDEGACGDVAALLSTSKPGTRAMNVFLVPFIIATDPTGSGTHVVGLDGSIPAPSTVSGTVWSGILASVESLRDQATPNACAGGIDPVGCGADTVGYVVAHETGHALGLYHVTEQTGTLFDPLTDTPQCPCSTCSPSASQCADAATPPKTPYSMALADCTRSSSCGGGDNLMFWLLDVGSSGQLTTEQGQVMRTNPYVY